jgi:hypothetical protein
MSESPAFPVDHGDSPVLSKDIGVGDKGQTLTQNDLLTDFEASDSMDSDERYLVRRCCGGVRR